MIKAKIIGACGYGGSGLLELLARHPEVEVTGVIDVENVDQNIGSVIPHLEPFYNLKITAPENPENFENVDVVFFATPDGVGMKGAPEYSARNIKIIDFSGDFRFNDSETYGSYAKVIGRSPDHASPDLLTNTVYGLSELHRHDVKNANVVGNPGCFAVSCILGLAPVVKAGLAEDDLIICDCKTGVSGAGKKPAPGFHYPARYDAMNAYKLNGHQHVFEIERELTLCAGKDVKIIFTPQVVPVCRGILSTLYVALIPGTTEEKILEVYKEYYDNENFVRLYKPEQAITTAWIRGTNFCFLTLKVHESANRLVVVSHIDNLVKGQAGSAVQNMNIMFGLDESAGLNFPGMFP